MFYDCSNKESFNNTMRYLQEVERYTSPDQDVITILVANKCDLDPVVSKEEIDAVINLGFHAFGENSSKIGWGHDQIVEKALGKFFFRTMKNVKEFPPFESISRMLKLCNRLPYSNISTEAKNNQKKWCIVRFNQIITFLRSLLIVRLLSVIIHTFFF
eukprot:TRINITY_DN2637_c0_g1_i16.p1 TRINITY_DN2637_c0_g1~~TRINITY_DN2637_c0_g1_i16.p1  ORF type:complete len:158 (+),score=10.54 TRINITY_DN2637_c0_g1_i16:530-1003(+)